MTPIHTLSLGSSFHVLLHYPYITPSHASPHICGRQDAFFNTITDTSVAFCGIFHNMSLINKCFPHGHSCSRPIRCEDSCQSHLEEIFSAPTGTLTCSLISNELAPLVFRCTSVLTVLRRQHLPSARACISLGRVVSKWDMPDPPEHEESRPKHHPSKPPSHQAAFAFISSKSWMSNQNPCVNPAGEIAFHTL